MKVDLEESRRLTIAIERVVRKGDGAEADRLREARRAIDERFDPEQALAGTVRYLTEARSRLGRDDLAVVSYHMGIGNLTSVIRAFVGGRDDRSVPEVVESERLGWPRIFFDSTPSRHAEAYGLLAQFGDDSPTYYWRVLAAKEIMRLYRGDLQRLGELDLLHGAKGSAEEVLHPPIETERFADGSDLERAWTSHLLHPLPRAPARFWFAVDPTMGELAPRLGRPKDLYQGLRAEALAILVYISGRVHSLSGASRPLEVTSTVRDDEYQRLLRVGNPEATPGYSLHTTGFAFDVRRHYESASQARAFQFVLDDLTARGLIAWIREPAAIHITVSSDASDVADALLEPAKRLS
jgi:hypothetical protein